jgi:hypothetical protein
MSPRPGRIVAEFAVPAATDAIEAAALESRIMSALGEKPAVA